MLNILKYILKLLLHTTFSYAVEEKFVFLKWSIQFKLSLEMFISIIK